MLELLTHLPTMPEIPTLLCVGIAFIIAMMLLDAPELDGMSCRNVYVRASAPPGGNGERETPFSSIQEAIDKHDADWGGIFIFPGIYREDVDIHRGVFWIMPAQQYGVIVEGTITVRAAWTKVRGLEVRSDGDGIVITDGAHDAEIGHCRITRIGDGCAGIKLTGMDLDGCLVIGNVVDPEPEKGDARRGATGILAVAQSAAYRDYLLYQNQINGCGAGIWVAADPEEGDPYSSSAARAVGNRCVGNGCGVVVFGCYMRVLLNTITDSVENGIELRVAAGVFSGNVVTGGETGILGADCRRAQLSSNLVANPAVAGINLTDGLYTLIGNTIYSANETEKALLTVSDTEEQPATIKHNIIAGPGELIQKGEWDSATRNLYSHKLPQRLAGELALLGDPKFRDPANGDFHLREDSPAIGKAHEIALMHDAEGIRRPGGTHGSLGAYEAPGMREPRTLYVGPDVTGGDGTLEAPYDTIQEALDQALPGDTVLLLPGRYAGGEVRITNSGAPDAPITIRSLKRHEAVFENTQLHFGYCSYLRLEGIKLVNPPHEGLRIGEHARHCEFVDNLIIRETEGGGHAVAIVGPGACDNLFERNTIRLNAGGCGIHIWCQRYNFRETIRNNDISGCYYAVQTGVGSYPTATPGYHIIESNNFHHNTRDGYHSKTTDDTLRNNDIHHNGTGGVTTRYGSRNVITGNRIHHNRQYGIRLHSCSHFVVNNMIYDNGGYGIHLSANARAEEDGWPYNAEPSYEPPHEVWIAHNTIVGNGRHPLDVDNGSRVMALRNILVGADPDAPAVRFGPGGVARLIENNLYHNARPPLLREYEGGVYEVIGDPELTDVESGDLRPAAGGAAYRGLMGLRDALSMVLSKSPAGCPLPGHIGAALDWGGAQE